MLDRLELEDKHCHRVRAAFAYTCEVKDFDDLVDTRHLFDCCLGPEPSKYMLEKIRREEKSKIVHPSPFFFFFLKIGICFSFSLSLSPFSLVEMATRYSKDKYGHIKNLKNELLANLTFDLKKRKLNDEKVDTIALPPVHTTSFSNLVSGSDCCYPSTYSCKR